MLCFELFLSPIALTALIELSSGAEVVEESADATLSYGDFYQQMALKHASEGSINKITFLDIRDQDDTTEDILTSDAKRHDIESSSGKKKVPYVIAPMLNSPLQRTLWDARSEESTRSSSSAVGNLTSDQSKVERRGSPVAQSLWSTAIFGAQKSGKIAIYMTRRIYKILQPNGYICENMDRSIIFVLPSASVTDNIAIFQLNL